MRARRISRRWLWVTLLLLAGAVGLGTTLTAQTRRPITHDVYASWKSIQGPRLSQDGAWLVYSLTPQEGDADLVARNLTTNAEWRHARGTNAVVTADGQYVVFTIVPPKAEVDKAKKEKKKPEEMPKNGLGIMHLATGKVDTVEKVKSFKVAEEAGRFVAYAPEPEKPKETPKPEAKKPEEKKPEAEAGEKKPKEKKKDAGTDLVVRELATGATTTIAEVVEYVWNKDGSWLAFGTSTKDPVKEPAKDGAFARNVAGGTVKTLATGAGHYKGFVFDEAGTQLAFLTDRDDYQAEASAFRVYHWTAAADTAVDLVSVATADMPKGWAPSEHGRLEFSKDGKRLFVGTGAGPKVVPEDAPEPVKVDIWSWKDPQLQPMQKVRAEQEKNRTFRAVVHLDSRKFVQLADAEMPDLTTIDHPSVAMGRSDVPYQMSVSWDSSHSDVYAVNLTDGTRRRLLEKSRFGATLSPGGTYLLTFNADDYHWYSIRVSDGAKTNLTAKAGVSFHDESNDTPEPARAHGVVGWTANDAAVLVYDEFDIWEIRPDGSAPPRLVTNGYGRSHKTVLRYVRLDPEERTIPLDKPLVLSATDDVTKASGYFRVVPAAPAPVPAAKGARPARGKPAATPPPPALPAGYGEPQKVVMLDKLFAGLQKPRKADGPLVFTLQRFEEFPNVWVADANFGGMRKVTDANPQQADFVWGRSELVSFVNSDGKTLRAILTKPDNFDPTKKYPLMVYIYEMLSQGLHRHVAPGPGTSINVSRYISNGYIVLQPDIVYETGYPGKSAMKCVVPAVEQVVKLGYIDPARIGIQGHSWGGYQISYMITQTNIFRAVQAGASVVNMTSAYGGIRWGTGMSRAFQYERTQSRIGAPPWIRPLQFIENSPLFWVERVNTPYLTIHNDEDDAVPWYQGIEFISALRRLGKEAYMFNYNGERHGLRDRENQKHWTIHMSEFFDHYLLGAPRPAWMDKPTPYLDRGTRDYKQYYGEKR